MSRYDNGDDRDRYDDRGGGGRGDKRGRDRRDDGYDDGYDDRRDDRGRGGDGYDDRRGGDDRDGGAIDRHDGDRGDEPPKPKKEKKEKKEKKKKRSASSQSAERSREREMKRREKQRQHASKNSGASGAQGGGAMAMGIPDPGAGGQRMFWDGFQWVPRADQPANPNDPNISRKMRRLYLGNLPYHTGITEDAFCKQLYETMQAKGMCNDPKTNPVLHIWFSRDKGANYGFCELATVEEADRCLQLDGIDVGGQAVSIKRPTDANAPPGSMPGMVPGQGVPSTQLALPPMQVQATTSIIRIEELLLVKKETTRQEYEDVVLDMNEGCGQHGKLKSVFVVRKEHADRNKELKAGDVFLQCASINDATKIMRAMGHRKYDGRQITMKNFEEYQWNRSIKPLMREKENMETM